MNPEHTKSAIDAEFERVLSRKLAVIEELRHDLQEEDIECPGVVVVGNQSAGKSSVLEQLTGVQFPREQNTCTRVPTIVALHLAPGQSHYMISKTSSFEDASTITCTDDGEVGEAIKDFQVDLLSTTMNKIADTLIDLPGIKFCGCTIQAFDIHGATSAMVHKYISRDDFGNAEALSMVKELDGAEARCIGVLTKCNQVSRDEGESDVIEKIRMLRDNDVKLDHGFIAVRNRAHREDGLTREELMQHEITLFEDHPVLQN